MALTATANCCSQSHNYATVIRSTHGTEPLGCVHVYMTRGLFCIGQQLVAVCELPSHVPIKECAAAPDQNLSLMHHGSFFTAMGVHKRFYRFGTPITLRSTPQAPYKLAFCDRTYLGPHCVKRQQEGYGPLRRGSWCYFPRHRFEHLLS